VKKDKKITETRSKIQEVQYIVGAIVATILVTLSFLLAIKIGIAAYPFNSDQQAILDYVLTPSENYEIITANGATYSEISHLNDVSVIMNGLNDILIFELLVLILLLTLVRKVKIESLKKLFQLAGIAGVFITAMITFCTIFFFDITFEIMHRIFFAQGNYQFSYDSYLISTLPAELFLKIAVMIFVIATIINLGFLIGGYQIKPKT
jgi:uncharacterized membrane protein